MSERREVMRRVHGSARLPYKTISMYLIFWHLSAMTLCWEQLIIWLHAMLAALEHFGLEELLFTSPKAKKSEESVSMKRTFATAYLTKKKKKDRVLNYALIVTVLATSYSCSDYTPRFRQCCHICRRMQVSFGVKQH